MKLGKTKKQKTSGPEFQVDIVSQSRKAKNKKVAILSLIVAVIIVAVTLQTTAADEDTDMRDVGIVAGILVGVFPISFKMHQHQKYLEDIDSNLPLLVQSLISSVESGMSLLHAFEQSADRKLGVLTPELKNFRANMSWGMSMEDAFDNLQLRVQTNLSVHVFTLLHISMDMGGDILDSLKVIQKHVVDSKSIEKERKSSLQPYVSIIYISFFVFLIIAILLVSQFFTEISNIQEDMMKNSRGSSTQSGVFSALVGFDVEQVKSLLFNMALIEAVFGGLAAGKVGTGTFAAGVKHVVILVIVTVIMFTII